MSLRSPRFGATKIRKALLSSGIALAMIALAGVPVLLSVNAPPAAAAATQTYSWNNVQIGGGGFVPDIVFNAAQQNLIYARTDIGGAYRWNQTTSTWTPLMDWVGQSNWGDLGVVSIAPDPINASKVYAAVGMYTNSWDPNNGSILRSSDQGATWQVTALPFKLGGNMPGRGMGERLAVDPNNDNVLYFGAPSGNGLWRSTDSGVTWAQVTSFPNAGNYVQDATDTSGYPSDNQGVVWEAFDKTSGTAGTTTKSIYVGVADMQNTVYHSTDGGATWSRVAGQPTGFLAHKGVIDPAGFLYIATSNKGGPYDGSSGDVWKYALATGVWTQISPIPSSNTSADYFGYSGLAIDAQHPSTIMVTGYSSWWPDTYIWRSTDGGATWKQAWDDSAYPNRTNAYTLDITSDAVADVRQHHPGTGRGTETRLDDRRSRDRPVQLGPDDVRHRRHPLRHHQPHQLGHEHQLHDHADGQRARGDRRQRTDQPADRPAAGLRARRPRRLRAHVADDRTVVDVHRTEPDQRRQHRLRRNHAGDDDPLRRHRPQREPERQPRRLLHQRRRRPGSRPAPSRPA